MQFCNVTMSLTFVCAIYDGSSFAFWLRDRLVLRSFDMEGVHTSL
jgi:hypothetical protein